MSPPRRRYGAAAPRHARQGPSPVTPRVPPGTAGASPAAPRARALRPDAPVATGSRPTPPPAAVPTLEAMGDTHEPHLVPLPGPDAHHRPPAGTRRPWENIDQAQAALDGATGPEPPAPPLCPECGLAGERRPTHTGQHVLLEPGYPLPAHLVPGGHRWYLGGDGTAWNGGLDEPPPGATCRIPHRLACPGLTLDEIRPWRWLEAVREFNTDRARRKADEDGFPGALPDVG